MVVFAFAFQSIDMTSELMTWSEIRYNKLKNMFFFSSVLGLALLVAFTNDGDE